MRSYVCISYAHRGDIIIYRILCVRVYVVGEHTIPIVNHVRADTGPHRTTVFYFIFLFFFFSTFFPVFYTYIIVISPASYLGGNIIRARSFTTRYIHIYVYKYIILYTRRTRIYIHTIVLDAFFVDVVVVDIRINTR